MPITDLTGTKWLLNSEFYNDDSPEQTSMLWYAYDATAWYDEESRDVFEIGDGGVNAGHLNFTSNNENFIGLVSAGYEPLEGGNYVVAYQQAYWQDQAYRTIEITGGTDATNPDLIAWLQQNATQIQPQPVGDPYLTFSSSNTFTLKFYGDEKYWDGTLEYSTDTTTWNEWDGITTLSSSSSGATKYLYLRGTNNTCITDGYEFVLTGSNISCTGNIENLLDYQTVANGQHPTMGQECYANMFYGCTNLITAPELPATTLAGYCYNYMFSGCTSLTTAPSLPATTLATGCYSNMFSGCSNLTTSPSLPSTTLATWCYAYMFYNCTNLTSIPELPTTTLTDYCYYYMFSGCSKIKLSSTQTGEYTQAYRIPTSGTGTTATSSLSSMFTGTGGTFTSDPTINTTYYLSNTNTIVPATLPNTYSLTHNLTNLTKGNITIQITPDTGYYLPSSITVTNGTLVSYNSTTGIAVISGDNAVVTVECSDTPSGYSGNIVVASYIGSSLTSSFIKFDTPPTSSTDYDSAASQGAIYGSQTYTNKSIMYVWGTQYNNGVIINNQTTTGGLSYDTAVQLNLTEDATIYLKCYATSG